MCKHNACHEIFLYICCTSIGISAGGIGEQPNRLETGGAMCECSGCDSEDCYANWPAYKGGPTNREIGEKCRQTIASKKSQTVHRHNRCAKCYCWLCPTDAAGWQGRPRDQCPGHPVVIPAHGAEAGGVDVDTDLAMTTKSSSDTYTDDSLASEMKYSMHSCNL